MSEDKTTEKEVSENKKDDSDISTNEINIEKEDTSKNEEISSDEIVSEENKITFNQTDEIVKESKLENEPIMDKGPKGDYKIEPKENGLKEVLNEETPLQVVMTRNKFYKDGYRIMQKAIIWQSIALGCMIIAFMFLFTVLQPKDRFFATTSDGRLITLVPLSEPLLKKPAIIAFASQAATEVMTFGFHDYRSKLQTASGNFTKKGWDGFLKALGDAKYIDTITNNRQIISAIPVSPPVIVAEGLDNGVYKWSLEVPLNISIESGSQLASKKILVKMVVARRSRVENDNGLGIDQWVTTSYSGN